MTVRSKRLLALGAALLAMGTAVVLWQVLQPDIQLPQPGKALLSASEGLDEIRVSASLEPESRMLSVTQNLTLQNRTGQSQSAVVLRAWANAFRSLDTSPIASEELYETCYPDGFSTGSVTIGRAEVSGEGIVFRYLDEAKTVVSLPLSRAWQPGETLTVELRYQVEIPRAAYRFGVNDGVWALGNALIVPALWQDGNWRTDEYLPVGDPFVSQCQNWYVTLSLPEGYTCAGSACPTVETADGRSLYTFEALAVRDFALVAAEGLQQVQAMEEGVLVTACALDAKQARQMLDYACKALKCYSARYGAYPYPAYTLCQTNMPMSGMEYPAFSMIGADTLADASVLEEAVAHETAHQWWYAAVGSDQWNQPWQDEALAQYSTLCYMEQFHGASARQEMEQAAEYALRVTVPRGVTPGCPLDRFSTMSEYKLVVYDRGLALMCALERMTGGLDTAFAAYYDTHAFGLASREDFETLLSAALGTDIAPLCRDYLDTYILN